MHDSDSRRFERVGQAALPAGSGEGRGSQVVRQRSAKPLFAGSIPARASCHLNVICRGSRPASGRRSDVGLSAFEQGLSKNVRGIRCRIVLTR